jgi:hypothetical protein
MSDSTPAKPTAASLILNPIPEDFYVVQLCDVGAKKPTKAGSWMVVVHFEIADGLYQGQSLTALAFSKLWVNAKAARVLGVRNLARATSYPPPLVESADEAWDVIYAASKVRQRLKVKVEWKGYDKALAQHRLDIGDPVWRDYATEWGEDQFTEVDGLGRRFRADSFDGARIFPTAEVTKVYALRPSARKAGEDQAA